MAGLLDSAGVGRVFGADWPTFFWRANVATFNADVQPIYKPFLGVGLLAGCRLLAVGLQFLSKSKTDQWKY